MKCEILRTDFQCTRACRPRARTIQPFVLTRFPRSLPFSCPCFAERFDVIGGTSTGAIIAGALGVMKKPVEEVEALYRELITKIFAKHPVSRYDR